ncbi:methionyl-tRNA formyltransferase [Pseudohaliea rubra]|uniref:Methionyl-tRNA formyltransferase n=1 Tax=Pseudohaliea rubra DSM 19751 TaxID=1265313 RepID=A0A095X0J4_9GAMM|nr:methionyl-tRNA formyltransferase [Pseudohaliea rubra]KGE04419.1 Methionyl-tRNA formyltransferase [Pseudohaliea rubra DSM 19751]
MKLLFAGTPEFARIHLEALLAAPAHDVLAVLTQPDRPAGRGKRLSASPVKETASAAGVPVLQPPTLRDPSVQETLAAYAADVLIVVAYGLILPQAVLSLPARGCLNVHASLLPRWRGAAPIQRAIEAGDSVSGVTIMQMDAGLDTGAMLATASCPVDEETTAADLHDRLAALGPPLLLSVLADLPARQAAAAAQDDSAASYASKIDKAEAALDWTLPAVQLARQIRAFNPFPVCFTTLNGERLKVWHAVTATGPSGAPGTILAGDDSGLLVACGEGCLRLTELQFPGGRRLPVAELLRARADRLAPGTRFGTTPA